LNFFKAGAVGSFWNLEPSIIYATAQNKNESFKLKIKQPNVIGPRAYLRQVIFVDLNSKRRLLQHIPGLVVEIQRHPIQRSVQLSLLQHSPLLARITAQDVEQQLLDGVRRQRINIRRLVARAGQLLLHHINNPAQAQLHNALENLQVSRHVLAYVNDQLLDEHRLVQIVREDLLVENLRDRVRRQRLRDVDLVLAVHAKRHDLAADEDARDRRRQTVHGPVQHRGAVADSLPVLDASRLG